jgi:hypothetical protein
MDRHTVSAARDRTRIGEHAAAQGAMMRAVEDFWCGLTMTSCS